MSKPINAVETRGNGYRCDCCARTFEDEDWIEKNEMIPLEELYYQALGMDPSDDFATVGMQYYDEYGNGIYGFSSMYTRNTMSVYISIGNDDFLIKENDQTLVPQEEIMKQYENFLKTKGDDE